MKTSEDRSNVGEEEAVASRTVFGKPSVNFLVAKGWGGGGLVKIHASTYVICINGKGEREMAVSPTTDFFRKQII